MENATDNILENTMQSNSNFSAAPAFVTTFVGGIPGVITKAPTEIRQQEGSTSKQVFISHSSRNADVASHLQSFLIKIGVSRDYVFCSSLPKQGIEDGEQINETIFRHLQKASLVIFLISKDFLSSSYCMEELGVGWFLSTSKKIKCYYLVLPDTSIDELYGFINKNTVKFTFLSEQKNVDLSVFAEYICEHLLIEAPKHTIISSEERDFWNNTRQILVQLQDRAKDSSYKEKQAARLHRQNEDLEEKPSVSYFLKATENTQLTLMAEYKSIAERFSSLGIFSGLTLEQYRSFNKEFWFKMVQKYLDLQKELNQEPDNYAMEILISTIFGFYDNYKESYMHFKNFIRLSIKNEYIIYPHYLDNFLARYPYSLKQIIVILQKGIKPMRVGTRKDSYLETVEFLEKRETMLKV